MSPDEARPGAHPYAREVVRIDPAARSGTASQITYRLLTEWGDLEEAAKVVDAIWDDPALASASLLRAYTHFGNPTIGAFDAGVLCGVSIGYLAPSGGVHLHSHITGVLPDQQNSGVGYGLKLAQRDWCLTNGVAEVTWTFDPLLARNAHFNMRKLGAVATALLPAFYGEMRDAFNLGDVTDRLETHWRLTSPRVLRALDGQRPDDQETRPIVRRIAIPWNYHELRASDAGDAATCRSRVREAMLEAFDDGLEVVDFSERGEYCFAGQLPR